MNSGQSSSENDKKSHLEEATAPVNEMKSSDALVNQPSSGAADVWAKHYTDQFLSGITKTNTILFTWLSSLLVILIAYIIPLSVNVERLNKIEKEINKARQLLAEKQKRREAIKASSPNKNKQPNEPQKGEIKEIGDAIRVFEDRAIDKEKKRANLEIELSNIKTPLGDLPIPTNYLPIVWMALFAGLLVFFLYKRVILLATLVHIIDIHMRQRNKPITEVKGLGSWSPFWLAPLPKIKSEISVSTKELAVFLGWEPRARRRFWLSVVGFSAAVLIYSWVFRVLWMLSQNFNDPQSGLRVLIIAFIISGICLSALVWGFWPQINLQNFPERLMEGSNKRRLFLKTSGSLITLGLIYTLMPRRYLPRWLTARSPRKRSRRQTQPLGGNFRKAFQLNRKTGTIHYINNTGITMGQIALSPSNLQALDLEQVTNIVAGGNVPTPDQVGKTRGSIGPGITTNGNAKPLTPHLPVTRAGTIIEQIAIEQIQKGNVPVSLKVLWVGIIEDTKYKKKNGGKPGYRLYDLFAQLASGTSDNSELSRLDGHIRTFWNEDQRLKDRKQKWFDLSSNWRKRAADSKFNWKPSYKE
jgi:hypothetical protein